MRKVDIAAAVLLLAFVGVVLFVIIPLEDRRDVARPFTLLLSGRHVVRRGCELRWTALSGCSEAVDLRYSPIL